MLPLRISPTNSLTPQKAYLFSKKSWEEKTLKTNFFHLYRTFLTTVLNRFQTSESVFQNMAHVRKYSFQMEVWAGLVNLNLFANPFRRHAPPPTPAGGCTHVRGRACALGPASDALHLSSEPFPHGLSCGSREGTQRGGFLWPESAEKWTNELGFSASC